MKKLLLLVPALLIMTGCSMGVSQDTQELSQELPELTQETQELEDLQGNVVESEVIIVEEEKVEFVPETHGAFTSTGASGSVIYYEGEATVSGQYRLLKPNTLLGDIVCFYADEETGWQIPRDPDVQGQGYADTRDPWFCFSNQEEVRAEFMLDNQVFADGTVECVSGDATVTISEYTVNTRESAVFDTARLEDVVAADPYQLSCSR